MDIKILEIRDRATMFGALCVNINNPDNIDQKYHLKRVGFPLDGRPNIYSPMSDAMDTLPTTLTNGAIAPKQQHMPGSQTTGTTYATATS